MIRLNKYLAEQGVVSRREADRLIADGFVAVNGKTVNELGTKIDPGKDKVAVRGKAVKPREKLIYILLNKPAGYITSAQRNVFEKQIVLDLIPFKERLYPVGRLDKDTTGLLLLTNDGDLTFRLTHPSSDCEKEYIATVDAAITPGMIARFEKGMVLDGEKTRPTTVKKLNAYQMRVILMEGKKRQIRRMCRKVGLTVLKLKRVRIKKLTLGDLPEGKWRPLTLAEVEDLKK